MSREGCDTSLFANIVSKNRAYVSKIRIHVQKVLSEVYWKLLVNFTTALVWLVNHMKNIHPPTESYRYAYALGKMWKDTVYLHSHQ